MHEHKDRFDRVLDMGAGDGRFARGGNYRSYVGVEIDRRISANLHSRNASFFHGCVFEHVESDYSACIGNPPYLRHNEVPVRWRDKIQARFRTQLDLSLDGRSNLYLYFISLGLQKTATDGLVSVLVPYEWGFIPSAGPIREYIHQNRWSVSIYRFNYPVFEDVMTTASISIIDKSNPQGDWKYFDIDKTGSVAEVTSFTANGELALDHEERGKVWAMRGLSPGAKRVFTLTESERVAANLRKQDVRPCVISLRELPTRLKNLSRDNFEKYFVSRNKKCWLIRTDRKPTTSLRKYIRGVPLEKRNSWTCQNQKPWYKYKPHPIPKLLMGSAFKKSEPRILSNDIKAVAVGSVIGIHTRSEVDMKVLHEKLRRFDFSSRIVPREEGLKKIAVKQVNTVLNYLVMRKNGRQEKHPS